MKMYEMNQITLLAIFEIKTWFAYLNELLNIMVLSPSEPVAFNSFGFDDNTQGRVKKIYKYFFYFTIISFYIFIYFFYMDILNLKSFINPTLNSVSLIL